MLINGKGQRLGDLAANTTVIKLKQDIKLEEIIIPQTAQNYEVKFPQVSLLSENDIQIIKDVINHRKILMQFRIRIFWKKLKWEFRIKLVYRVI